MPNPVLLALGAVLIAVVAYWIGGEVRAHGLEADHAEAQKYAREFERQVTREVCQATRRRAFAQAAEAAGCWPHRITKRADLMRHLEALGLPSSIAGIPAEVSEFDAESQQQVDELPPGIAATSVASPDHEATLERVESYRQEGLL